MKNANKSKLIKFLTSLIYKSNNRQMKMGSKISEEFKTSEGLLQGCCMSPALFRIYIYWHTEERMGKEMWESGSKAQIWKIYFQSTLCWRSGGNFQGWIWYWIHNEKPPGRVCRMRF